MIQRSTLVLLLAAGTTVSALDIKGFRWIHDSRAVQGDDAVTSSRVHVPTLTEQLQQLLGDPETSYARLLNAVETARASQVDDILMKAADARLKELRPTLTEQLQQLLGDPETSYARLLSAVEAAGASQVGDSLMKAADARLEELRLTNGQIQASAEVQAAATAAAATSGWHVHRPLDGRHVHRPEGTASGQHVHRSAETSGRQVHYPSVSGTASGQHVHRSAETSGRQVHYPSVSGAASGLHVHRPAETGGRQVHYPSEIWQSSTISPPQPSADSVVGLASVGGDPEEFEDVPIGKAPEGGDDEEFNDVPLGNASGHDGIIIMVDLSNDQDIANLWALLGGLKSCSWSQKIPKYILYNDQARHQSTVNDFKTRFGVVAVDMDKQLGDLRIWSHPQEYSESTKFADSYSLGYRMMCEAWGVKMPEVAKRLGLKYFMRLDSDSKMTCDADRQQSPFDIMRSKRLKYGYYNLSRDFWYWTQGFRAFLIGYAATHQKNFLPGAMESMASLIADPDRISVKRAAGSQQQGEVVWLGRKMFYNNFEILQVDHFLQDSVKDFTAAVAKSQGIYKHRWGDAVIRYYQVALFAKPEEIGCFSDDVFHYSHANNLNEGRNSEGACTKQIV
eukprot:TRINITY_DN10380_c0_g1_i1.p1 TRINITY_DN10380_c0_g1~~TRINITY_DN10380_c0_g1_i1.p1  ORF type:complete len:621 (-),score=102.78 TRINITY_DN10380_c0_g1_i1:25-1887(-)